MGKSMPKASEAGTHACGDKEGAVPLKRIYKLLRSEFGFLNWWPGETRDEILIGAILTQNTSWKNVEKAIANLREARALSVHEIANASNSHLEGLIRPSGFYRQKSKRLKRICSYINGRGGLDKFFRLGLRTLKHELMALNGIGNETADSILLYAAGKPVFVIDAYTKRIMSRVYGISEGIDYISLQGIITKGIERSIPLYKDFHAQFVELAKNYCRKKPVCGKCPLKGVCVYASAHRA